MSYRRETALQGGLVLAECGRLELGDNILRTLYSTSVFNHCDVIGQQSHRIRRKKRKIRAITPFKVIRGQSRSSRSAHMRLPISSLINTNWHLSRTVSELSQLIVQLNTLRFRATLWGLTGNVRCSS